MNFTQQQTEVLNKALRGEALGSEHLPAIRALTNQGLIKSRKLNLPNYPATPGGMVWHKWQQTSTRVAYRVYLTQDGKETLGVLF
jgi:hypothetical protein